MDFSNPDIKNPKKLKEKDGFFQKIKKMQVKVGFLQKSIFFLEFFEIFDLETQKSKHPFEESKKIQKKNPWEIQKSIFLTWIQRFCLKRWIFGFLGSRLDHACLQHSDIRCIFAWNTLLKFSHIAASPGIIFNYKYVFLIITKYCLLWIIIKYFWFFSMNKYIFCSIHIFFNCIYL